MDKLTDEQIRDKVQHVLDDIAHIDAPLNPLIQPELHHPPQRIAVPLHQAVDRLGIACLGAGEQVLGFLRVRPHRRIMKA